MDDFCHTMIVRKYAEVNVWNGKEPKQRGLLLNWKSDGSCVAAVGQEFIKGRLLWGRECKGLPFEHYELYEFK